MSPLELETIFADALRAHAALAAFTGLLVVEDKADSTFTMPAVIVKCEMVPLTEDGSTFDYGVDVFVETTADGTGPRAAHTALFSAVQSALIAAPTALRTAVNAAAVPTFRAWAAKAPTPGISGKHFHSGLGIAGCAF